MTPKVTRHSLSIFSDDASDYSLDLDADEEAALSRLVDDVEFHSHPYSSSHQQQQTQTHQLSSNYIAARPGIARHDGLDSSGVIVVVDNPGGETGVVGEEVVAADETGAAPQPAAASMEGDDNDNDNDSDGNNNTGTHAGGRSILPDIEDVPLPPHLLPRPSEAEGPPPLVRFRTYPRKPFSVSDLTAGAWCEMQYFYTLSCLPGGRKAPTPAMEAGTRVHRVLEEAIHGPPTTVEVLTGEDRLGVRLWNLIHGLRTLRNIGETRELEVWGTVDGYVVNGVVDMLSLTRPVGGKGENLAEHDEDEQDEQDEQEEQDYDEETTDRRTSSKGKSIRDYFPGQRDMGSKVYITDVKTRGSSGMPRPDMMRPAKLQLYLYHRFLWDMIADRLDYLSVFRRYGLDPDQPFSDRYIAQMGQLNDEIFEPCSSQDTTTISKTKKTKKSKKSSKKTKTKKSGKSKTVTPSDDPDASDDSSMGDDRDVSEASDTSDDPLDRGTLMELPMDSPKESLDNDDAPKASIRYATLRELVPLLASELALAFPRGPAMLGQRLCLEYRDRESGCLIGRRVFDADPALLDAYLDEDLKWWRGDRGPRGVEPQETFKCRFCDFRDDCEWLHGKNQLRLQTVQERLAREGRGGGMTLRERLEVNRQRLEDR